ncbi:fimbria/pilus outer membrane usher protein [Stenotrophomonas maltophilia]|nr:fimbria/pilus outer membrane usher protein [Stenotrophomonas maltophilia]
MINLLSMQTWLTAVPLRPRLRRSRAVLLLTAVASPAALAAPPGHVQFNRNFLLGGAAEALDLDRFEAGHTLAPGMYTLDVSVNDTWVARAPVHLVDTPDGALAPCVADADLQRWGIVPLVAGEASGANDVANDVDPCRPLHQRMPYATAQLDALQLTLNLNIPQRFLARRARDWVDPSQWEQGTTAALLDYSANVHAARVQQQTLQSASLGYRLGFNSGPWRLRHTGFVRREDHAPLRHDHGETYLQRDLQRWNASLRAGEGFTPGDLFSSAAFTGVQVASDDRMLPQSQRGYAPLIEGVAESAARIRVYQQGRLLHETNVAPGPFRIEDLYATAYNGELEVVITEADGRERRYLQPFSAVAQLLRPGQYRFSASAGQAGNGTQSQTTPLLEATWRGGWTNTTTVHAGFRSARHYHAAVAGAAFNTRLGGMSADVTATTARRPGGRQWRGQAYRTTFSRDISATGTHLSVAAYRYSTRHYLDLVDLLPRHADTTTQAALGTPRSRSRFDISASQTLPGSRGRLWVNGSWLSYWDDLAAQASFSAGYSHVWRAASYAITARRSASSGTGQWRTPAETSISLTVSVPLGRAAYAPTLMASSFHSPRAQQARLGLSASASDRLNYYGGIERSPAGALGADAGLFYQGHQATANINAVVTGRQRQFSAGATGGIVAHAGGLTFAHALGETFGLVHAPDAQGATVDHGRMRVDRRGYAVVPHLTPYRAARVEVDPRGIPETVRFTSTSKVAVPTAGAMVRLPFTTETLGSQHTFIALASSGEAIPFGAKIVDDQGDVLGIVGQSGQAWFTAAPDVGRVRIHWRDGAERRSCGIDLGEVLPVRNCETLIRDTAESPRPEPGRPTSAP